MVVALLLPTATWAKKPKKITQTKDEFINELMSRMTLEEKLGQLNLLDAGQLNTGVGKKGVEDQSILNGEVGGFLWASRCCSASMSYTAITPSSPSPLPCRAHGTSRR